VKDGNRLKRWGLVALSTALMLVCGSVWAGAEETAGPAGWRPIYDNVMLVINFLILAFLIVKLARNPLKSFLKAKHDEVAHELERLETERESAEAEVADTKKRIAEGNTHILEIKERIVAEGEQTKRDIIKNARKESEFLIESAKWRIKNRFSEARQAFRAQLIESAMSIVARRLPAEIGSQDHDRQVNLFFDSLDRAQGRLAPASTTFR